MKRCKVSLTSVYSKKRLGDGRSHSEYKHRSAVEEAPNILIETTSKNQFHYQQKDSSEMIIDAKYFLMDMCHCTDNRRYTPGNVKFLESFEVDGDASKDTKFVTPLQLEGDVTADNKLSRKEDVPTIQSNFMESSIFCWSPTRYQYI